MKKLIILALSLFMIMAIAFTGCQPAAVPAKFDVSSMQIKPNQITAGESTTITAVVTNVGGSSGIYNVVLSVDTVNSGAKSVELAPGVSKTVTFSLSQDTAGTFDIEVGSASGKLIVNPKLVAKKMELKYDSGFPQDYLGLDRPATGYLVSFVPPSTQFVIDDIQIMGLVYGGKGSQVRELDVQIWDKNQKPVFSASLPGTKFPQLTFLLSNDLQNKGDWVDLYVPDIKVDGNFYVHIYTGIASGQGFRMGVDNSAVNTHSDVTMRDANGADNAMTTWPYQGAKWFGDKSRVTWMVRVNGNAMVPEQ